MDLTCTSSPLKRIFDLSASLICLAIASPVILLAWVVSSVDTRQNGFFVQRRVGRHGKVFNIFKIRTMRVTRSASTVTVAGDCRITVSGYWLRKYKIDELPQLFNVLKGDMSFVGPRPDVPGFADLLVGDDRRLLALRPGITGPASLKYCNESEILVSQPDPEAYNANVLWPDKVKINLAYARGWSLALDFKIILATIFS